MRGLAKATLVAIVIVAGAFTSAPAQQIVPNVRVPPPVVVTHNITPLGWFFIGSIACAAGLSDDRNCDSRPRTDAR